MVNVFFGDGGSYLCSTTKLIYVSWKIKYLDHGKFNFFSMAILLQIFLQSNVIRKDSFLLQIVMYLKRKKIRCAILRSMQTSNTQPIFRCALFGRERNFAVFSAHIPIFRGSCFPRELCWVWQNLYSTYQIQGDHPP